MKGRTLLLGEPQPTAYDLNFNVLGFQVRIHPLFWLLALIFSSGGGRPDPSLILIGIPAILVSILVHELGHALAMRYYGQNARIVLYAFGGLAIPETGGFNFASQRSRRPMDQIVISGAGPFAGFLLAVVTACAVMAAGGKIVPIFEGLMPRVVADTSGTTLQQEQLNLLVQMLLFINIWWTILNLMPVYPLDGGQIAREVFVLIDSWRGIQNSLYLSLFIAGLLAFWGLSNGEMYLGLLFGSLAYSNWEVIQQISGRGGGFGGQRGPW